MTFGTRESDTYFHRQPRAAGSANSKSCKSAFLFEHAIETAATATVMELAFRLRSIANVLRSATLGICSRFSSIRSKLVALSSRTLVKIFNLPSIIHASIGPQAQTAPGG